MSDERKYQVWLLPELEVVERGCNLREADAWTRTYNRVIEGDPAVAVIAEDLPYNRDKR